MQFINHEKLDCLLTVYAAYPLYPMSGPHIHLVTRPRGDAFPVLNIIGFGCQQGMHTFQFSSVQCDNRSYLLVITVYKIPLEWTSQTCCHCCLQNQSKLHAQQFIVGMVENQSSLLVSSCICTGWWFQPL